jgi:sugar lactone lactonase YvrE
VTESFDAPGEPGSLGLTKEAGAFIVGFRDGFALFNPRTEARTNIADPEPDKPQNRLNDGKMDRAGRYWCGSMKDPDFAPVGVLYRVTEDGRCVARRSGITVPNCICWSPDNKTMYFADSSTDTILAFDYDIESGEPSNERVFATVNGEEGHPDGATVDAEGYVWAARIFGNRLSRFAPDGSHDRDIMIPAKMPTCPGFGGPSLDTLYITTACLGMDEAAREENPGDGLLYMVKPGVTGVAETPFGGA